MATKKPKVKYVYDPSMCEKIIELGRQGATQKAQWAAIGISKSAADTFKKNHPEFAEAANMAVTLSQAWWENEGIANLNNRSYNTRLYEVMTKAMFPEDYRESKDQKVDVRAEVTVDFAGAVNDLIKQLKAAKE